MGVLTDRDILDRIERVIHETQELLTGDNAGFDVQEEAYYRIKDLMKKREN